ncbi:macrolide export protein MacA [Moorella thermoacetica]|uniref:Macrolide export protein MacA n=2 Tax=Neomoorella thermoacetica TaxID=1525 RepID=A0A1J5JKC6_NEOTH|nr:efflux RND transporter periplasmic adaptor subunit [Moorella thermoacetica]OIQ09982.1 macrolide export protein MacA [Moorella thermoacetica]OIQ59207.1 macrolide export protein MacA [Moorella thermoacetica]
MPMWGKRVVALLLVGVLALGVAGCGARAGASNQVTVKAVAASKGKMAATVEVTGALVPARTANVVSKLSGQVTAVKADVGDRVRSGQVLVEIDTKELQAQLQQAEAAVRSVQDQAEQARIGMDSARVAIANAKVALDAAQKYYDRIKALADAGAASQSQLDDAQTKLDQAKNGYEAANKQYEAAQKQYETASGSGLAQAEAAVNIIKVNMSNASITSPITGVVTNRNINPGEMAAPTSPQPLLTIADTSTLKLQGTVGQEAVPLLSTGQKVTVTLDALPGREFTGTVTQVGPVAATTGQRFPVEISLPNPGELKAGMTARAVFKLTAPEGVVVPLAAVRTDNGQDYVFVVKNGTVERRQVVLGLKNDEQVMILKGLQAGEQVAVTNVGVLQDKMAVTVE